MPVFAVVWLFPASQTDGSESDSAAGNEYETQDLSKHSSVPTAFTVENAAGRSLRKSAFVGIGGLGGAVLSHLKGLYRVNATDASNCPLLYIDTDGPTRLLTISQRHCRPKRSFEFRCGHQKNTAPRETWTCHGLAGDGCSIFPDPSRWKGIRPLGRLALFDHLDKTRTSLQQILEAANGKSDEATPETAGEDQSGLDVYVVASTSGGSGSGMVADNGLMIREIAKQNSIQGVRVCSVLMHSTGTAHGTADVQEANTVATLRELGHMTTPGLGTPRGFSNDRTMSHRST